MSASHIRATFINRRTGEILGEAPIAAAPPDPISTFVSNLLAPFSPPVAPTPNIPPPSSLNYQTDLFSFTDVFDFTIELATDELINIKSHDFVEFFIVLDSGVRHQIGVGFLEKFVKITEPNKTMYQANGRDLFGQFMFSPFTKPIRKQLTMRRFMEEVIKGSYLENYHELRLAAQGRTKIRDLGSLSIPMFFRSDLEQKKGALVQSYSDLAINLIYMNRLGQAEILGRPGTSGSTAPVRNATPIGTLRKGSNVDKIIVVEDFTQVFSEYTVFWTSSQAEQDRNSLASSTFKNTDPRVSHIDKPGFRTFNTSDLVNLAGSVSGSNRIRDVAKSFIRKSNRNISSPVVLVTDPFFTSQTGLQIPYEIGQKWTLKSNEPEFTTARAPDGTDNVQMILAGISYGQTPDGQSFQLKFIDEDTVL